MQPSQPILPTYYLPTYVLPTQLGRQIGKLGGQLKLASRQLKLGKQVCSSILVGKYVIQVI